MDITFNCLNCDKEVNKTYFKKLPKIIPKFCSPHCRHKKWCQENREKLNANVRKYRAKRYEKDGCWRDTGPKAEELKRWMMEIKSKPCSDCGGNFPVCCMDFDHKEGEQKSYNIGSMFAHHYSKELIETELAKCELVCSNCHRIRTRDRRTGSGNLKYKKTLKDDEIPKSLVDKNK